MAFTNGDRIILKYVTDHWEEEIAPRESKSFIITNPTANSDAPLWRVPYDITLKAVHGLTPVGVITGHLYEYDANGLNGATVDGTDITTVEATNTDDDGSLSNPVITAGNYLGWKTTSVSGSPTRAMISFEYTIN